MNFRTCAVPLLPLFLVAIILTSAVTQAGELPPEFRGSWVKTAMATGFNGFSYWELDAAHQIQVYMDGATAWFHGAGLEGLHTLEIDAQQGSFSCWIVEVTATCHEECSALIDTGFWPGPTDVCIRTESYEISGTIVCPEPPCLRTTDLLGASELAAYWARPSATSSEAIPFSVLKSRF